MIIIIKIKLLQQLIICNKNFYFSNCIIYMRTRKNKKYLKKRKNKTRKYGGVAKASAQVTTRYGRPSNKPATFAQEQGTQREIETEQRIARSEAAKKARSSSKKTQASKPNPTITKTRRTKVGPWGTIKYNYLMPVIEEHNKKAHSDGPYMGPITLKNELDKAFNSALAKENINSFVSNSIRIKYYPEFLNKYIPKNVLDIYSKINIPINSNMPLSDKAKARIINDLKELKLDENSDNLEFDNLEVLKDSPVYKQNYYKLKLLLEEAYPGKAFLQDF